MSDTDVNNLIGNYLISRLNNIFQVNGRTQLPAALVVFDPTWGITGRFRASGYTDTFKDLFPNQLRHLRESGMEVDEMGLLNRAANRFAADPKVIWGYSVEINSQQMSEANLSSKTLSRTKWQPIPKGAARPGQQLNDFIVDIKKVYTQKKKTSAQRPVGKYLILIPYSASETFLGLVLLVWITDALPPKHLDKALKFLRSEGVLLSAQQSILVADASKARADGYRRFASLVRHEENGFVQTLEGLISRLADAECTWKHLEIGRDEVEFLKTTMGSKKDLNEELSDDDPLHKLNPDVLYTEQSPIRKEMPGIIHYIEMELKGKYFKIAPIKFGKGISPDTKISLKLWIIERVIRNAIKNADKANLDNHLNKSASSNSHKNKRSPVQIEIFVDINERNGRRFLELIIDDNAGGLLDKDMPRDITPEIWTRYRADNNFGPDRGNGFWIISRYATSSGGIFRVEDILEENGVSKGVRYKVVLGLRD